MSCKHYTYVQKSRKKQRDTKKEKQKWADVKNKLRTKIGKCDRPCCFFLKIISTVFRKNQEQSNIVLGVRFRWLVVMRTLSKLVSKWFQEVFSDEDDFLQSIQKSRSASFFLETAVFCLIICVFGSQCRASQLHRQNFTQAREGWRDVVVLRWRRGQTDEQKTRASRILLVV